MFDKDGNGYVSANEIKHVRNYLDMEITDGEVDEMVVEADSNNDAQVDNKNKNVKPLLFSG